MIKRKYQKDFFVYIKRHHWFLIPTIVFYYNKNTFLETGVYTPAWGLTLRWLTFMVGVQIQTSYE
jgi:hypothetical protein